MKNITNINTFIAGILGGFYFKTPLPLLVILFYLFKNKIKNNILYLFLAYLLIFGYFINPASISMYLIIFMLITPHILVMYDLITEYPKKYHKKDYFIVILLLGGVIYPEMYIVGIILLVIDNFQKYVDKKTLILLIPIVAIIIIFLKYPDILNQNYIYKILVLTGFGIILYAIWGYLTQQRGKL